MYITNVFMKEYTTALLKLQWGENLVKFDGITLPRRSNVKW